MVNGPEWESEGGLLVPPARLAALELRIRHFALLLCPLLRRPWPTSCRGQKQGLVLGHLAGQRHGMRGVCVVPGKQPQNGRLGARDTLAWHHHKQVFASFGHLNSHTQYAPQPTGTTMTEPVPAAVGMASRVPPQVLLKTALDYVARRGTS
jgi:hypothetical protein